MPETPSTLAAPAVELSSEELGAWRGFLRVHAALAKELDAELEAAHGLSLSSYEVLVTLLHASGHRLRMAELAESALLSRSGMTRLVDRLERAGLIARSTCSSDARGCYAELTDEGRELVGRARATHLAGVRRRFLSALGDDDLRRLAAIWERVLPGAASTSQT